MNNSIQQRRIFDIAETLVVSAFPAAMIAGIFKWGYAQSWTHFLMNFALWLLVSFTLALAIQGVKTVFRKRIR